MKKVLFIDRDGTLIVEPPDEQIDRLEKFQLLPGVVSALSAIRRETDFELVMVTNQDGLGTASFPEETFWPLQNLLIDLLRSEGIEFSEVHIDRSFPHEQRETRKPGIGMLRHYLMGAYDMAGSFVIGDRATDIELAARLGCKAIFITSDSTASHSQAAATSHPQAASDLNSDVALSTSDWSEIRRFIIGQPRRAQIHRRTSETDIRIDLDLDGRGESSITTGIGFFDHMLDQLARHGGLDLRVTVAGDLHIDEHHTIEDVGLALGQAFDRALGGKKGLERYGFMLPMDDALAQVAIDFGGRPMLMWDVPLRREKIGEMPTEMVSHFFKSFCDAARCNLNIRAEGDNEHHKVEAVFKGWARAIRMAVRRNADGALPSTKGLL